MGAAPLAVEDVEGIGRRLQELRAGGFSPTLFTTRRASSEGLVVLALDGDRVALDGIASSGWIAVGAENTVTQSELTDVRP